MAFILLSTTITSKIYALSYTVFLYIRFYTQAIYGLGEGRKGRKRLYEIKKRRKEKEKRRE